MEGKTRRRERESKRGNEGRKVRNEGRHPTGRKELKDGVDGRMELKEGVEGRR